MKFLLGLFMTLLVGGSALGDVIFTLETTAPSYSANIGGSTSVGLLLRETTTGSSVSNFGSLSAVVFRLSSGNSSIAQFGAFTPGGGLSVLTNNPTMSTIDFVLESGVSGLSPVIESPNVKYFNLGTISVSAMSAGTTNIQIGASPDSYSLSALGETQDLYTLQNPQGLDFQSLPSGTTFSGSSASFTAVPEPSSMVLLGLLSVPAVAYRRWKKARA